MKATKRILVVDDDAVVGKSIERVLAPRGYAVMSAASGEEALARLANEDYDMVYTDIRMPGMDGIEVARRIRASRPWMPVLIITGYGTDENEAAAKEIGVQGFLRKPLAPEAIEDSTRAMATAEAAWAPVAMPAAPAKATGWHSARLFAKNAVLFFAAPLVALFYVLVGPFVAIGLLGWVGVKALLKR